MIKKGDKYAVPFIVNVSVYNGFMVVFNDKNNLHTDEDYARKAGFKSIVMHGNILNGFLSYFIGECLPMKNVIIHSQQIEFKNPFYLNDTIKLEAQVVDVHDSVKAFEFEHQFLEQTGIILAKGKFQIGLL